ncbi:hypothetical protein [Chromobacterium phragmitis]|uniref:Nucleotide-diphospho-sugar transferase domain-containing protein n=1 Tax=Chromobacterium phragmitis TaxID=2202141 RepID=A0A344UMZ5_9NEIS|nr:hypothetical protein [Chromobacterium phragmitis]AXE36643.1 hypothetical protein DK843_21505 [Chromobacterium phragmitis]
MALHIVYLSHGGKKYHDQTRFSILTLLHLLIAERRDDIQVAVYTDDPASVPQHELIKIFPLTAQQLRSYRGQFDYVHRIKLMVMQWANAELGSALMYVDCDTRWLSLPHPVFQALEQGGVCCMHVKEGSLGPGFFPEYQAAVRKHEAPLRSLGLADGLALEMWNSGVIGTPAGADAFYASALAINDYLLPRMRPRNWTEQFALSLVACSQYRMLALGDALHHYWNYSYEAPIYLQEVFSAMDASWDVERQARYCAELEWDEARLKAIQAAPEHKHRRRSNKWRASIAKRKIDLRAWLALLTGGLSQPPHQV